MTILVEAPNDIVKSQIIVYRDLSHKNMTQYWRYFGAHSHRLPLIKKQSPRIVNLHIDEFNMGFDGRL